MFNKRSMNPITFRQGNPNIVIARFGMLGKPQVHVMLADTATEQVLGHGIVDESLFISGLGHVFPGGELASCHYARDPVGDHFLTAYPEIPLGKMEPCQLGVGALRIDVDLVTVHIRPGYFGVDVAWYPDEKVEAAINQIPGCHVVKGAHPSDGAYIETAFTGINALNDAGIKLPSIAAQVAVVVEGLSRPAIK